MKIEEKFNKRSAELIEVAPPSISYGNHLSSGIRLWFSSEVGRNLRMHLTPEEALNLGNRLIDVATKQLGNK